MQQGAMCFFYNEPKREGKDSIVCNTVCSVGKDV